jgi:ADP-ribosylglycohydrolase
VPESIICFLEGNNYEDVVRKAVSLGGDTDTQACIAGSIAEAYYGIPDKYICKLDNYLPEDMLDIIVQFNKKIR